MVVIIIYVPRASCQNRTGTNALQVRHTTIMLKRHCSPLSFFWRSRIILPYLFCFVKGIPWNWRESNSRPILLQLNGITAIFALQGYYCCFVFATFCSQVVATRHCYAASARAFCVTPFIFFVSFYKSTQLVLPY